MVEIDILMATYNGALFIGLMLDSIQKQTFPNWRIVIRDDGSSDGTTTIIRAFQERHPGRVVLFEGAENVGSTRSFMWLLTQAESGFIVFADQDDIWHPHKLETMKALLESSPHQDAPLLAFSNARMIDENGYPISANYFKSCKFNPNKFGDKKKFIFENPALGCTMIFNRQAAKLAMATPFCPPLHDWLLMNIVSNAGYIIFTTQPTIDYRIHPQNTIGISGTKWANLLFSNRSKRERTIAYFNKSVQLCKDINHYLSDLGINNTDFTTLLKIINGSRPLIVPRLLINGFGKSSRTKNLLYLLYIFFHIGSIQRPLES